jgi:hypothetical protein
MRPVGLCMQKNLQKLVGDEEGIKAVLLFYSFIFFYYYLFIYIYIYIYISKAVLLLLLGFGFGFGFVTRPVRVFIGRYKLNNLILLDSNIWASHQLNNLFKLNVFIFQKGTQTYSQPT